MNPAFYINVAQLMELNSPKCTLSRPKLRPTVIVNDNEWLQIITVEAEI